MKNVALSSLRTVLMRYFKALMVYVLVNVMVEWLAFQLEQLLDEKILIDRSVIDCIFY